MSKSEDPSGKINIVGPDYGNLMKQQTNTAIIEAFIALLFSKNTKFGFASFMVMIRNLFLIIMIKIALEESASHLDKFKFTNLNSVKYMYQRLRYSEKRYDINLISSKWTYDNRIISTSTLTPFLESKSIYLAQPGVYYYRNLSHLIKVTITPTKLTFAIPKIDSMIRYVEKEIINRYEEILFGGKTSMFRVIINNPNNMVKIEPVQLSYAFPTDNYTQLEESIRNYFFINEVLKTQTVPFCVNFDGEPGTGKTTFSSHIASSGIFNKIYNCNLVQTTHLSFMETVNHLERQMNLTSKDKKPTDENENVLIMFDEIDKWIESYINTQIHKLREEARGKKTLSKGGEKSENTVIETFEKLTPQEEEEKKIQLKSEFLDQLYKVIDGHVLSDVRKYVIIFNTNHFDTLFDGVDQKKYHALRDRFQKYKFYKSGKQEVISYIKNIIAKMQEYIEKPDTTSEKRKIYQDSFRSLFNCDDSILSGIPNDIQISYRSLLKIVRNSCFRPIEAVRQLKLYHEESLINQDATEISVLPLEASVPVVQKDNQVSTQKDTIVAAQKDTLVAAHEDMPAATEASIVKCTEANVSASAEEDNITDSPSESDNNN